MSTWRTTSNAELSLEVMKRVGALYALAEIGHARPLPPSTLDAIIEPIVEAARRLVVCQPGRIGSPDGSDIETRPGGEISILQDAEQ